MLWQHALTCYPYPTTALSYKIGSFLMIHRRLYKSTSIARIAQLSSSRDCCAGYWAFANMTSAPHTSWLQTKKGHKSKQHNLNGHWKYERKSAWHWQTSDWLSQSVTCIIKSCCHSLLVHLEALFEDKPVHPEIVPWHFYDISFSYMNFLLLIPHVCYTSLCHISCFSLSYTHSPYDAREESLLCLCI